MDPVTGGATRLIDNMTATRQVQHPGGSTFPAGKTAQEIFDNRKADDTPDSNNVFNALATLQTAMAADPFDQAALGDALDKLKEAAGHVNDVLASYGATQNRVTEAQDSAQQFDVRLRTQLANHEDADIVSAAVELSQATTARDAALAARAKLPRSSLFDYLG